MALEVGTPASRKWAKHLYFSPAGHGKTSLIASAQEDDRTYPMAYIDWEAGTESLDGLDIDIFPVHSWGDVRRLIELLDYGEVAKIQTDDGKTRKIDFGEYRSVGIDSVSEWNRWAQLQRLKEKGPGRNDPDLIELQDYGVTGVQLRRELRRLRDLPMHVFFAAHAKTVEDKRLGRITLPDLSGQLAEEVAGLVSTVGYLALADGENGEERILLLHGHPRYRIKVRTPWQKSAPEEIEEPTITEILDVLGYKK
jgi:hypothetical protein